MQRHQIAPRRDWQSIVEGQGMHFHTTEGDESYWNETAYYEFESSEIDLIEAATYACNDLCLKAVQHVIDKGLWDLFLIPPEFRDLIVQSWDSDERSLYGRFDFSYRPGENPMLLEYNADTPTSLLEAAVIQWFWLKDRFPNANQFNSIHERLIEAFMAVLAEVGDERFYFAAMRGSVEDYMTVQYLRDCAVQAGFGPTGQTEYMDIEDLGWNGRHFTDKNERRIAHIFKLYPWEWMFREGFGGHLNARTARWYEPPWKALLSNKAILVVLSDLFSESPFILRAAFEPDELRAQGVNCYARKPILAREGANVTLVEFGDKVLETPGPYDGRTLPHIPGVRASVFQELWELPTFDGRHPVVGSWVVNGWACGMGVREDTGLVTGNTSKFTPHIFGAKKSYGS